MDTVTVQHDGRKLGKSSSRFRQMSGKYTCELPWLWLDSRELLRCEAGRNHLTGAAHYVGAGEGIQVVAFLAICMMQPMYLHSANTKDHETRHGHLIMSVDRVMVASRTPDRHSTITLNT
jgi:hypothetical protein